MLAEDIATDVAASHFQASIFTQQSSNQVLSIFGQYVI